MAIPVLIIGKSGAGKSTSMRNCVDNPDWGLIKVIEKPLPFKGSIPSVTTDDYKRIENLLAKSNAKSMVIDDAGYLITNYFMRNHSSKGQGNAIFSMYNTLADSFWGLVQFVINDMPADKIVYVMMHEDTNELGETKPKTIGKLLDEKICLEGMFTIVLRAVRKSGQYMFVTQADDGAVSKSPLGMFDELEIDNDLALIDAIIRKYYDIYEPTAKVVEPKKVTNKVTNKEGMKENGNQ